MNRSTDSLTQSFMDALHRLEDAGDFADICGLFAEDAPLQAPGRERGYRGPEGARRFWGEYLNSFSSIHSDFDQVIVGGSRAALSWTARGRLRHHRVEIAYPGVTLLEFRGDRIARFRTVFDRSPFQAAVRQRMSMPAR